MTTDKIVELLSKIPSKELVVIADGHAYELETVVDCMHDACVLLRCKNHPPEPIGTPPLWGADLD